MKTDSVSLKEFFEQRFDSSDRAVSAALAAAKEAVLKAEAATEKRFESVNEFRNTLSDQQRTLMPRSEAELIVKSISDRLKVIEDARLERTGEAGGAKNLWIIILGVASFISTSVGLFAYLTKP